VQVIAWKDLSSRLDVKFYPLIHSCAKLLTLWPRPLQALNKVLRLSLVLFFYCNLARNVFMLFRVCVRARVCSWHKCILFLSFVISLLLIDRNICCHVMPRLWTVWTVCNYALSLCLSICYVQLRSVFQHTRRKLTRRTVNLRSRVTASRRDVDSHVSGTPQAGARDQVTSWQLYTPLLRP